MNGRELVMTPQLQLAIKLLAMRSTDLPIEAWKAEYALEEQPLGDPDPLDAVEAAKTADDDPPPWFPATESHLPALDETPDVWVFGNPPQARANRQAYPRLAGTTKEALWLLRSLRQRARTYERVVQGVVDRRPLLAVTLDPDKVELLAIRELAETIGLHESTVERVASAVRFQNLHGVLVITKRGNKLGFAKVRSDL